jgi:hypothetical protein
MMKAKNGTETRGQKSPAWLPLLISACLMLVGFILHVCANGYLQPQGVTMFYPLVLMMKSSWQGLLQAMFGGGVVLLHLLALKRGVDRDYLFGSVIITGLFVVVLATFVPSYTEEMIPLQSLSTEEHTYRLVLRQWESRYRDASSAVYVVLECDPWGLICGYLVTPTACIEEGATLMQDPTSQHILMSMGTKVYDVNTVDDVYYPMCILKGLNR